MSEDTIDRSAYFMTLVILVVMAFILGIGIGSLLQ
jgi:hypothetical protein